MSKGKRTHRVLEMALEALRNHAHRGAVADDRKTGDGAGMLTQLPYEFFGRELSRMGIEPPAPGDLAVGQIYLNKANGEDRAQARELMREVLAELKLEMLAFRSVPVIESALGQRALVSRPWFGQIVVRRTEDACEAGDAFERLLYLARKRIVNTGTRAWRAATLYRQPERTHDRLQGPGPGRGIGPFLPGPERPGLQDRDRRLPPALQHQYVSHLGTRPALPLDLPQRRDQHPARQRELDAGARGGSAEPLLGRSTRRSCDPLLRAKAATAASSTTRSNCWCAAAAIFATA